MVDYLFILITNLGSELFLLASLPIIYYYRREIGIRIATIVLTGIWLTHILKAYFKIERPPEKFWKVSASGYSFPSGHSTNAASYWGYLAYRSRNHRILAIIFILLIPLIGYSRVYLGVHRFEDIIGGFIVGLFSIILIEFLFRSDIKNRFNLYSGLVTSIILPLLLAFATFIVAGGFISEVEVAFKTMGALSGVYFGYIIAENKQIHLEDTDKVSEIAIRSIIALVLIMIIYLLNKLTSTMLLTYVFYWFMGLSITLLVPIIIKKTRG